MIFKQLLTVLAVVAAGVGSAVGAEPFQIAGKVATIKDVGLGPATEACAEIEESTFGFGSGSTFLPTHIMNVCRIGREPDRVIVYYNSDRSEVVRVLRYLYVDSKSTEISSILASAEEFYGAPEQADTQRNRVMNYGDAYHLVRDGRRVVAREREAGTGLLIQGENCAVISCPKGYTVRIMFDLVDQAAYAAEKAAGGQRLKDEKKAAGAKVQF